MTIRASWIACMCWVLATSVALGADSAAPPWEKPGWKLTFHDEFDRPQLNDMYWFPRTGRVARSISSGSAIPAAGPITTRTT